MINNINVFLVMSASSTEKQVEKIVGFFTETHQEELSLCFCGL